MLVKEIMNYRYPSLHEDELATKARAILREQSLRMLPIVDNRNCLVGTVSRRHIMSITSSISPVRVRGLMITPPFIATIDMDALEALKQMNRFDKWYVGVVKSPQDKTYLGVLELENFITAFLKMDSPKLAKPVFEIMTKDVVTCSPNDEIDNVWRRIQERKFAACPVAKKGKLVGMVTQADMLESGSLFPAFESKKGRFKKSPKISALMKTSILSVKPESSVKETAELLLKRNIGRLPVIDEKGELVGIVDREDIVKSLA